MWPQWSLEEEEDQSEKDCDDGAEIKDTWGTEDTVLLTLKMKEESQGHECKRTLEAGKSKKLYFPLKHSEGMQPC